MTLSTLIKSPKKPYAPGGGVSKYPPPKYYTISPKSKVR